MSAITVNQTTLQRWSDTKGDWVNLVFQADSSEPPADTARWAAEYVLIADASVRFAYDIEVKIAMNDIRDEQDAQFLAMLAEMEAEEERLS